MGDLDMTMSQRTSPWVGVLCVAALAGCSSSSGGGPANAKDFCRDLAGIEQDLFEHCAGEVLPPFILAQTILDCQGFQEARDAGRIAYSSGSASSCLDTIRGWSCAEAQVNLGQNGGGFYFQFAALPASCQEAVVPQVQPGGDCFSPLGYECVGGYCDIQDIAACFAGGATCVSFVGPAGDCSSANCQPGYHCDTNVCVIDPTITILAAAGDCTDKTTTICNDGLICDCSGDPCTCIAKQSAGGPCSSGSDCLEGLFCLSDACAAPLAAGATCLGGDCAPGLFCNDSSVCAAYPHLGELCPAPSSGDFAACVDSWCDTSATPTPICTAYLDPGATCASTTEDLIFTECGPGYGCYPVDIGMGATFGVCGRVYCLPF
jgi:hypothetical protein